MASVVSTAIATAMLLIAMVMAGLAAEPTVPAKRPKPAIAAPAKPIVRPSATAFTPAIRDVAPRSNKIATTGLRPSGTRDTAGGRNSGRDKSPNLTADRPPLRVPPPLRTPPDRAPPTATRPPVTVALPPVGPRRPVGVPRRPPVAVLPLTPPPRQPDPARPPSTTQPGQAPSPAVALEIFVADEVLIALALSTPETLEADVALAFNLTILERSTMSLVDQRLVRLRIPDRRNVADVVAALQADARVQASQPNFIYRYQQSASVRPAAVSTEAGAQYTFARIGLADAPRLTAGLGTTIAVIDSGIERAHPDFADRAIDELDALDSVPRVSNAMSSGLDPHGTGVAGIIAGRGLVRGISPDVRLLSVRAFGNARERGSAFAVTSALVKGLNWSVEKGARVVNMSFAGVRDPAMERNIAALVPRRIVAIAAAGNGGAGAAPAYPAAYATVIAVTATDASDRLYEQANHGAYIAVAAPGVDVLVPTGRSEHDLASGTSFAAPHVAGLVALMLDVNPALTPSEVRDLLMSAVDDLGRRGRDDQFGAGRIHAGKAIAAAAAFRPVIAGAP